MNIYRMLWAVMASALVVFFALTRILPPGEADGSALNTVLPGLAVADLALSFVIPKMVVRGREGPGAQLSSLAVALAICESVALMGMVLHLITGWEHAWTLFLMAGLGMLLHFPRGN